MLRHSNIKTTLEIYSHTLGSKQWAVQGQFLDTLLLQRAGPIAERKAEWKTVRRGSKQIANHVFQGDKL
jgi:hypothetical protein